MQKNKIMKLSTILLSAIVASSLCFESFFVDNSTCEAVVRKVVRRKVVTNRTSNQTQIERNTDNDFFENNSDNIVEEIPAKNTSGNRRINVNDSNNVSRAAGNPVIKPVSRPESNTAEVLLGDVNGDGKVTLTDVSVLKNYLTGQYVSKFNERNADMNGDGNVSITDLSLLKNSIVSGNTTTATNTTNTNQNNLQLLQIVYPAEGLYSLQPYSSPGMELSVEGANAGANANVYITDIGSDKQTTPSHQKWYLTRIGNSEWYKITAENSGLALNIHNGIAQNGNNVTLYPYGGTMHQFRFLNAGNGWYCLQGNVPGQFVLTVDNGGSTAGTNVNIHQYNAGVGQCWKLVRRNPATTVAAKEEVAQRYVDVYKDAALQSRYSGRWIGKGETYTVVQASGNALLVNYKSSNGEDRQGWVNKNVREEIDVSNVQAHLEALISEWNGRIWDNRESNKYGIQCKGFASYIFNQLFNTGHIGNTKNIYQINIAPQAAKMGVREVAIYNGGNIQDFINMAKPGDFLQMRRSNGGVHSAIFVKKENGKIFVFDANRPSGTNKINYQSYAYNKFANEYSKIGLYSCQ